MHLIINFPKFLKVFPKKLTKIILREPHVHGKIWPQSTQFWLGLFSFSNFLSRGEQDRGERIVFWWPNTNTNIIQVPKNDRTRIRILFRLRKMTEYEYQYYWAPQKPPNTNTNINRLHKNDRIQIRILLDSLKTQIIFFCISTTMQYQRSIHSF